MKSEGVGISAIVQREERRAKTQGTIGPLPSRSPLIDTTSFYIQTMFEFEKLSIYHKAKDYHQKVQVVIDLPQLKPHQKHQLSRASLSILLNIAEGSSRFTKPSKRNFYTIARGSVFECVAMLDVFNSMGIISKSHYQFYYDMLDEISRILYSGFKN